jgi:hypothetical protein
LLFAWLQFLKKLLKALQHFHDNKVFVDIASEDILLLGSLRWDPDVRFPITSLSRPAGGMRVA